MQKSYISVFGYIYEIEDRILNIIGWDVISEWNLKEHQIDNNHDKLHWTKLSTKKLSAYIMFKYADKIKWRIFLLNKYDKPISGLIQTKDYILKNSDLFHNNKMRKKYYTNDFIYYIPEVVNWTWVAKHVKLDERNLIKYWNKLNKKLVCQHQNLTELFMESKSKDLQWRSI